MEIQNNNIQISVIIPALNEEKNILAVIGNTLEAFEDFNIKGEIIIINDGSTDRTEELVNNIIEKEQRLRMISHDSPQGIGASFWEGMDNACGDIVTMLPGDNENDPREILRYYKLLEHVDIVIPFIFNKEARSLFRNTLSLIYRFIINTTFLVNFKYTNGSVLYQKSILKGLHYRNNSFFFQTDILIRVIKKGYLFVEVPYRLNLREHGMSKAITLPSLIQVIKGYLLLVRDHYFRKDTKINVHFPEDSLTAIRRQNKEYIRPDKK